MLVLEAVANLVSTDQVAELREAENELTLVLLDRYVCIRSAHERCHAGSEKRYDRDDFGVARSSAHCCRRRLAGGSFTCGHVCPLPPEGWESDRGSKLRHRRRPE